MTPALKAWLSAARASAKASEARTALPFGSSRARVTTANARWSRHAEERDRLYAALSEEEKATADSMIRNF